MQAVRGMNTESSLEGLEKASWWKQQPGEENEPDQKCLCRDQRDSGHGAEVLKTWRVKDNTWNARRNSQGASCRGPCEPWTSSKGSEKSLQRFTQSVT